MLTPHLILDLPVPEIYQQRHYAMQRNITVSLFVFWISIAWLGNGKKLVFTRSVIQIILITTTPPPHFSSSPMRNCWSDVTNTLAFAQLWEKKVAESRSFTNICRRQFPAKKQDLTDEEGSSCRHGQVDAAMGGHDVHVCFLFSFFKAASKETRWMCHNLHSLAAGRLALHFDGRAGWERLVWLGN